MPRDGTEVVRERGLVSLDLSESFLDGGPPIPILETFWKAEALEYKVQNAGPGKDHGKDHQGIKVGTIGCHSPCLFEILRNKVLYERFQ